jgi:hypothetical protein
MEPMRVKKTIRMNQLGYAVELGLLETADPKAGWDIESVDIESVQVDYAHWGKTKLEMRIIAISLLEQFLKADREEHSYPQDGSKGQAKAYHWTLVESLKGEV